MTLLKSWAVALAVLFAGSMANAMLIISGLVADPANLTSLALYLYLPLLLTLTATTFAAAWPVRAEPRPVVRGLATYTVPGLVVLGGAVVTLSLGTAPLGETLLTLVVGAAGTLAGSLLTHTLAARARRREPAYY